MQPNIISTQQITDAVSFDTRAIEAIEAAFASLAGGSTVIMPPVMQINVEAFHGQTCVKSAYVAGASHFVVKLASTWHDNHLSGLPNSSGLMLICQSQTGQVDSILLDNGYLTALRTQAAGAVAAKHLSRASSACAGIIGAGKQAGLQLAALLAVRPIEEVRIWSPDMVKTEQFCQKMSEQLGIKVQPTLNAEQAVREMDIIVTTTPAREPIIRPEWLSAGQHITAMGADSPGKSELFPDVLAKADRYIADSAQQCRALSELNMALKAGAIPDDYPVVEIGDVITGLSLGRTSEEDITIADLTGLGVQDTAIALLALDNLKRS
ncbi:ornithine cyclodeaminase family protein [Tatumella sp. UBA2305]|uniref:ornithine cyclodeaminase family protein n=1 Tax=Tatumella sp. UBA2305 TaxID=1947647 RepID=UPI0025FFE8D3|nr:ornithine cyclodeaminase family protein [Tatumella sp. UBA2305]